MINLPLKPVILLLFILGCFTASAQVKTTGDIFIQKATTAAADMLAKQPAEKVYLHLDKPYYAARDDVWFKAYVTSGPMHEMSAISGALTVELLDEKGNLSQTIQLPLRYGLAAGDFHIPNDNAGGKYQIRAFTNYMRNWGNEYFYSRPITISGAANGDVLPANAKKTSKQMQPNQPVTGNTVASLADVQFFPESGSLVNGVSSRVAFKATGPDGKGVPVQGLLLDNSGNEVARFASRHLGMGSFYLTPIAGVSYTAKMTFRDGSQNAVKLPVASNSGYVLSVSDNKNNPELTYSVAYSGVAVNDTLVLIGQSAGNVCYIAKLKLKPDGVAAKIAKSKLPTGITQLTLFKQNGEPVAERLIFVDHHDQLNITLLDSNKVNSVHQSTTIQLTAKDAEAKAVGSFSVAVIDDTKAPASESAGEESMLSYLLLSSELKGKIEAPADYFKSDTAAVNLDLLMLTQGYRHFEWKKVLNNTQPQLTYLPQKGITASGRVLSLVGKPLPGTKVTMYEKKTGLLLDTVTNAHGDFAFNNMLFTDSLDVLLTAQTKDNRDNLQIKMDKPYSSIADMPFIDDAKKAGGITLLQTDSIPAVYRQLATDKNKYFPAKNNVLLKEVKVKEAALLKVSIHSSNLNGAGHADEVMTSKDIEVLGGDMCQVLGSGRLMGIVLQGNKLVSTNTMSIGKSSKGPRAMLVMVDGARYNGDLCSISAINVESVEILRTPGYTMIYGGGGANGVVIITLKRGGLNYKPPGNAAKVTIGGFYKAREFYSPKYDDNEENMQFADLRSTIYWNPNILTDKDGNASFSYYNAGAKGTYRVIVQGIDVNGKLGYQVLKYNVE